MAANRLPSHKHHVTGCADCPLRVDEVRDFDAEIEPETVSKCGHPEIRTRDVTGEEDIPDFCPLIRAPLLLVLDEALHG